MRLAPKLGRDLWSWREPPREQPWLSVRTLVEMLPTRSPWVEVDLVLGGRALRQLLEASLKRQPRRRSAST